MNKQPDAVQARPDAIGAVFLVALITSALAKPEQSFSDTFGDALDAMLRTIEAVPRGKAGVHD